MADTGANGGKGEFAFAVKASQTGRGDILPKNNADFFRRQRVAQFF